MGEFTPFSVDSISVVSTLFGLRSTASSLEAAYGVGRFRGILGSGEFCGCEGLGHDT